MGLLLFLAAVLAAAPFATPARAEALFFQATLSTANEVPPVTATASGLATITIVAQRDGGGNVVSATVYFDVDHTFAEAVIVNGLHIHEGAASVNGPIRIDSGITTTSTVSAQGAGNIFRAVNVTAGAALTAVNGILANPANFYVNLHTSVHAGGLMRGQLQTASAPPPAVFDGGVVNNASFAASPAPLAPGSIAAVFGKYLNDGSVVTFSRFGDDGKLVSTLGGSRATVNGIAAPMFYSTFGQVGIQIPAEATGTTATIEVTVGGRTSVSRTIFLDAAAPGIFTFSQDGKGAGAILHADGAAVTATNPARPGEVVVIFGTGLGQVNPPLATGSPSTGNRTAATPAVTIDGIPVEVQFSGAAPGFVGLNQLNVRISESTRSANELPLAVTIGGKASNTTTIAVQAPQAPGSNPVPAIANLFPTSFQEGDPASALTINGTGFLQASTVTFNGVPKAVTFASDTRLTIQLTASDLAKSGTFTVVVINPAPGGGSSNVVSLSVISPPPDYDDYY